MITSPSYGSVNDYQIDLLKVLMIYIHANSSFQSQYSEYNISGHFKQIIKFREKEEQQKQILNFLMELIFLKHRL